MHELEEAGRLKGIMPSGLLYVQFCTCPTLPPPAYLQPKEVLNWCLQLLTALEFLDAHCVVHRDLKLSNLMLTSQGVLKVTDFGQAVQLGKDMTIPFMSGEGPWLLLHEVHM